MTTTQLAFNSSLIEMKSSYLADLAMIDNYSKVIQSQHLPIEDHLQLLKKQLQLMIDSIDQVLQFG